MVQTDFATLFALPSHLRVDPREEWDWTKEDWEEHKKQDWVWLMRDDWLPTDESEKGEWEKGDPVEDDSEEDDGSPSEVSSDWPSDPQPPTVNPLDLEVKSGDQSILTPGCVICTEQPRLKDCGDCRAVTYCGKEHMVLDRPSHKEVCNPIKACRMRAEIMRRDLITDTPNPFFSHIGHFWLFPKTKGYLLELSTFVELHEPIKHRTAVERQLVFAFHILYMGGTDILGYRFKVPALMIRINRDSECYDFMKWRNRLKRESLNQTSLDYMKSRFANPIITKPIIPNPRKELVGYRKENIFESLRFFDKDTPIMTLIPLCLVKIKFMFQIQRLQLAVRAFGEKIPNEVLDIILKLIPYTKHILEKEKLFRSKEARQETINTLLAQILEIYHRVQDENSLVWKGIVWWMRDTDTWTQPDAGIDSTVGGMKQIVKWNWESWVETPGAISLLQRMIMEDGDL